MQVGMIGLGRMGASLVRRLAKDGHECVVYDVIPAAVKEIAGRGIQGAVTIDELLAKLGRPRAIWLMVPAAVAGSTVEELASRMEAGDIIIDGGNSYYRDDIQRARALADSGIHFVDCGTSGGVFGLDRSFCLMIGGAVEIVKHLDPIFKSIAPGVEAAPRTPGKRGAAGPAEQGYLHCGPSGAGHFVKMVHNGIEYGLMTAYAEGLNVLRNANAGKRALLTREDAVEAAWAVVAPVLKQHHRVKPYKRGSWGPNEADALIAADGSWYNPRLTDATSD